MPQELEPGSNIALRSVPNLRDLGGWPIADRGSVRRGVLFRSTELDRLAGADLQAFAGLGIRTVFDLRTEAERRSQPDRVPEGTEQVVCDVLADDADSAPAQLQRAIADPKSAAQTLGGGRAAAMFEHGYRQLVTLPSAQKAYSRFFSSLADATHRPAIFHCSTGKDRTGWAAAVILTLLGVSEEDVMKDYLLTNAQLLPALQPVFDRFQASGGDPDLLRPVLGVRREYLEASFVEMHRRFGGMEDYLTDGLRLSASTLDGLRAALTDGAKS